MGFSQEKFVHLDHWRFSIAGKCACVRACVFVCASNFDSLVHTIKKDEEEEGEEEERKNQRCGWKAKQR